MKKLLNLFVLAVIMLSFNTILAEEKTDDLDNYEIVTIDEKIPGSSFIHFIHFKNRNTGEIVKTIDLIKDNPYNHLPFEIDFVDDRGNMEYKNVDFDELFPDKSAFMPAYIENVTQVDAGPGYGLYLESENYVIVTFYISSGVFDRPCGSTKKLYIYNSKSEIIFSLDGLVGEGGGPCITPDGKYLAYTYGQASEYLTELPMLKESAGVKVYDIGSGEIILDRKPKQGYILNGIGIRDRSLIIALEKRRIARYEIVRFDQRKIYGYDFLEDERNKLRGVSRTGIKFGESSFDDKKTYFRSIETDFEVEEF